MTRTANYNAETSVLIITIDGAATTYTVTKLDPDPAVAFPAFRLHKASGEFYDVSVNEWGAACTCADATYRNKICKHCSALKAVGLIS